MAVTSSKQWIHFFLSDLWPPTSTILNMPGVQVMGMAYIVLDWILTWSGATWSQIRTLQCLSTSLSFSRCRELLVHTVCLLFYPGCQGSCGVCVCVNVWECAGRGENGLMHRSVYTSWELWSTTYSRFLRETKAGSGLVMRLWISTCELTIVQSHWADIHWISWSRAALQGLPIISSWLIVNPQRMVLCQRAWLLHQTGAWHHPAERQRERERERERESSLSPFWVYLSEFTMQQLAQQTSTLPYIYMYTQPSNEEQTLH